jgi:hypothetical protein
MAMKSHDMKAEILLVETKACVVNMSCRKSRNDIPERHEDVWGSGGTTPLFMTSALDPIGSSVSRPGENSPRYSL